MNIPIDQIQVCESAQAEFYFSDMTEGFDNLCEETAKTLDKSNCMAQGNF